MKRANSSRQAWLLTATWCFFCLLARPSVMAEEPLEVGFSEVDITPDVRRPVWLAGYTPGRRAKDVHDPLYETLCAHMDRTGESFRLKTFNAPTSVENLAHKLFTEITSMGFRMQRLEVREELVALEAFSQSGDE